MARTHTVAERNAIAAQHNNPYGKLELRNSEGVWVDVSSGLGTTDWLNGIVIENSIDAILTLSAELLRNDLTSSMSPLMTASSINRDSLNAYAPFLDVARQWRAFIAVVPHAQALVAGDWKEIGGGLYDLISVNSPSPVIQLSGRDWGASLLDLWINTARTYGDDAVPVAMETVIQQMLDDNLGAGAITLYTPVSPAFGMKKWTQAADTNVMAAINAVADLAGFVVRYEYDAADAMRLTLYKPNRAAIPGEEVWTLGPDEYFELPQATLDISGVRNRIEVKYVDEVTNQIETIVRSDAASIARFGGPHAIPRTMAVDLSADTNIRTAARATALGDAILADTAYPPFEHQYEVPGFWIAQLRDYGKFLANGVHYDEDQYGGVTAIRHVIQDGMIRTYLTVGGQPKGRYRAWAQGVIPTVPPVSETVTPPTVILTPVMGSRSQTSETIRLAGYKSSSGTDPLQYQYRIDDGVWSAWDALGASGSWVDLAVGKAKFYDKQFQARVRDAGLVESDVANYSVIGEWESTAPDSGRIRKPIPYDSGEKQSGAIDTARSSGLGRVLVEAALRRSGLGGVYTRAAAFLGFDVYGRDGLRPLINADLERVTADLDGPTGIGMDVVERGGNKGDQALDASNIAVAAAVDFTRAYTGKNLANVPDDATSDRRAATANQKTGGDRAVVAIDSGGVAVAAAIDFSRSYTGKSLANVPDDATSDRRAATATEKTGGGRAATALDASNKLVTGVTSAATADDGTQIESIKRAKIKAAHSAGVGAQGLSAANARRSGEGGTVAAPFSTVSTYDEAGSLPLINTLTKEIQNARVVSSTNLENPGGTLSSGVGISEGGTSFKLYRHREEITASGPDTDGDVAVTFAQTYQNAPMIFVRGGQYVTFSNTLGTDVKQRLRMQVLNPTASGFTSRAQIANPGATTAQADDFPSGNLADAVGETVDCDLTPGDANDNTYTVHYFVEVTAAQADPTQINNVTLTLAIDTNDGGGWVERATFNYQCSTDDSGPSTISWSHEQKPITVSGLGSGTDIRVRAKALVYDSFGSFKIRGGDAGGSNPETYNGVTYTTASDTTESAIPATGDYVVWVAQEVT